MQIYKQKYYVNNTVRNERTFICEWILEEISHILIKNKITATFFVLSPLVNIHNNIYIYIY